MEDSNTLSTQPRKPELKLTPPPRPANAIADPGAHELGDGSESDDYFSDAQSAPPSATSPIPRTRVEKVSHEPRYGEVPGTEAYHKRSGDAEPDEIAVIPDAHEKEQQRIRAASIGTPTTPGGFPIPKTVVEVVDDDPDAAKRQRPPMRNRADSRPDVIIRRSESTEKGAGGSAGGNDATIPTKVSSEDLRLNDSASWQNAHQDEVADLGASNIGRVTSGEISSTFLDAGGGGGDEGIGNANEHSDEFGDDFDDFEEGAQDADFGDFQEDVWADGVADPDPPPPQLSQHTAVPSIPTPDFENIETEEVIAASQPYIAALFPAIEGELPVLPPLPRDSSGGFLSSRSASLWAQLVAPPSLQPPDWIRSRIRRAFLVSLGVPVDLDEILPASKQKKLVLPSPGTPRGSLDVRTTSSDGGGLRSKGEGANASSPSVHRQGLHPSKDSAARASSTSGGLESRRSRGPPEPKLDLVRARQLCMTTQAALDNMTEQELKDHVQKLEEMKSLANDLLEYWTRKQHEQAGDREAFEGVIENLVKHARKVRK